MSELTPEALLHVVDVAQRELATFAETTSAEVKTLEPVIDKWIGRLERLVDVSALAALVQWDAAHNNGQHAPDTASAKRLAELLRERGVL